MVNSVALKNLPVFTFPVAVIPERTVSVLLLPGTFFHSALGNANLLQKDRVGEALGIVR